MPGKYPGNIDDTVFGNVTGHVVPGTFFILFGIWWLFNVLLDSLTPSKAEGASQASSGYRSRTWYACCIKRNLPVEPWLKFLAGSVGIVMELSGGHWTLFNSKGDFEKESLNNFSHATMFAFFTLTGVVEILQFKKAQFPPKLSHVVFAFFFFVEGYLFYFHLDDGRDQLDVNAHVMLYSISFSCALVLLLEAYFDNIALLGFARCYLVLLQGTWFYQIAFMLYGRHPWSAKSHANLMFLPIAFSWHLMLILILILIGMAFRRQLRNRCLSCGDDCRNAYDAVSLEYLLREESNNNNQNENELEVAHVQF